jgi:hypothetical protein
MIRTRPKSARLRPARLTRSALDEAREAERAAEEMLLACKANEAARIGTRSDYSAACKAQAQRLLRVARAMMNSTRRLPLPMPQRPAKP